MAAFVFSAWHIFVDTLGLNWSAYKQVIWICMGLSVGFVFPNMLLSIMIKFMLIGEYSDLS